MLERSQLPSVITTMREAQIRWAGHVSRMSDSRIPKQLLYGELSQGARKAGGQRKRFKDSLKANLKDFNIDVTTWENAASERSAWKIMVHKGALRTEAQRSNTAKVKRSARKARAVNYTNTPHTLWCQTWLQGLPCPHLSHQQSADTSLNDVKCRLTWSYSKIELTNNNTKCGHFY